MKRQLTATLTIFVFLFSAQRASLKIAAQQSSAQTTSSKTIQVSGLHDKVTVRRDERGIPYIEAKNDEDLYFAQGFVTASDRLWQMDLFRRNARGELAEIFGAGPNNSVLEEDKRHRTFGFAQVAEAEAAQASPQTRLLVEAFAKGVNTYIASLDAKSLPPEFQVLQYKPRPWTPADSLIIAKNFFESLSSTWRLDIMREGLADLPPDKRAAMLPETSPLDVLVVGKDDKESRSSQVSTLGFASSLQAQLSYALTKDHEAETRSLAR